MKPKLLTAILLLSLSFAAGADTADTTATGSREVWTRAMAVTGGLDEFVPGRTVMTMEFLNRRGEVDEVMKVLVTTRETDGELVVETTELERPGGIIGAIMSGETPAPDGMTSASQDDDEEASAEEDTDGPMLTDPFHPAVQDTVRLGAPARPDSNPVGRSTEFPITWTSTDGTRYDGTIWLDDDTGGPVRFEVDGDSYNDSVRSLSVAVEYQPHESAYLPAWSSSEMEFRFALLIRVRVRVTLEFNDYFEHDSGL